MSVGELWVQALIHSLLTVSEEDQVHFLMGTSPQLLCSGEGRRPDNSLLPDLQASCHDPLVGPGPGEGGHQQDRKGSCVNSCILLPDQQW